MADRLCRPPAQFRFEFLENLQAAVDLAGGEAGRVVVVTLPDHSVTPAGKERSPEGARERVERYNAVIEEEARKAGARLVDLFEVSQRVDEHPDLVVDDGLHPSEKGHRIWTDQIYPVVSELLEDRRRDR